MLHVVQMIDRLGIGGAEKLLVKFASGIQAKAIRLTVVSLRYDEETPIPDELRNLGAQVLTLPARKLLNPYRIRRIVRFLNSELIDVVHTHLAYANIIGMIAARLAHIPAVATLHNTEIGKPFYHPIRRRLETWLLRNCTQRVVAVGHAVAEANRSWMGNKSIEVIPNAIDEGPSIPVTERAAIRAELMDDPARHLLISVGRLTQQKGFSDLLSALAMLRETHPSTMLVIVGRGSLYQELSRQIKTLGLEDNVRLLGVRNDVPRLLAASDMYVSSSLWEGLPVTLLEAMAAGLPVVATGVGDVSRVIIDGTGVIVPPQEPAKLAAALGALLDNPIQRRLLGVAAKAHTTQNYSLSAWVNKLLSLYEEVCDRPQTAFREV